ncbi:hypothetical protein HELRODRAFT_194270 [Helobdella robusta]|uniref:Clusterin-associated protein 1 n=1 Tax=Helobdella robusta TaxID=6412 RepID=T1FVV9_HELRO|nr:hypothetical protein HELRODRAFT_194270 [Helobdella robusta]ESN92319.1 hypothetical protein HELRODRAFT_194270 [Helobdella robusta]
MSYRDLRSFTEIMRAIGYKRLISLENFKKPNFPLLYEILKWLLSYFEPNVFLPNEDIQSCYERVKFVNFVSEFMLTKANIKINPKKLYEANGYAVKELLKIVQVLHNEVKLNEASFLLTPDDIITIIIAEDEFVGEESGDDYSIRNHVISSKCRDSHSDNTDNNDDDEDDRTYTLLTNLASRTDELREARVLVKEITEMAANLYFKLAKEVDLSEARFHALTRHYDLDSIEHLIGEQIKLTMKETLDTEKLLGRQKADKLRLNEKFERKAVEMDRCLKRYDTLISIRPVYLKEFESLEVEFEDLFRAYVDKHKNVAFLENLNNRYEMVEQHCKQIATNMAKESMERARNNTAPSTTKNKLFSNSLEPPNSKSRGKRRAVDVPALATAATTTLAAANQPQHKQSSDNCSSNSGFFAIWNDEEDENEDGDEDGSLDDEDGGCDEEFDDDEGDEKCNINNNRIAAERIIKNDDEDDGAYYGFEFGRNAAILMMTNKFGECSGLNNLPYVNKLQRGRPKKMNEFDLFGGSVLGTPAHSYHFFKNKRFAGGTSSMVPDDYDDADDDDDDNFE